MRTVKVKHLVPVELSARDRAAIKDLFECRAEFSVLTEAQLEVTFEVQVEVESSVQESAGAGAVGHKRVVAKVS